MKPSDNFFTKVGTKIERERTLLFLVEKKIEVQCRTVDKSLYLFEPVKRLPATLVLKPKGLARTINGPVVITFSIGTERFFLKTSVTSKTKNEFILDMSADIYKLQRRYNYRLNFPPGYAAEIEVRMVDGKIMMQTFDLANLSGGGLAFETSPEKPLDIKKGDSLAGLLNVKGRLSLGVAGAVKHYKPIGSMGSGVVRIGVEFMGIGLSQRESIIQTVMDLHRDFFGAGKFNS